MNKTGLTIDAMFHLTSVAAPQINHAETEVIYNATTLSKAENKYFTQLFSYQIETGLTKQLTEIPAQHYAATWSPDDQKILFLSTRMGKAQLFLLNKSGGEAIQLTENENAISKAIWGQDNQTIFFTTKVKDVGKEKTPPLETDKVTAKVIEDIVYRKDTIGYIDTNSHTQIFKLNLATNEVTQLTRFNTDCSLSDIHPTANKILYSRSVIPDDPFDFNQAVYELNIDTGAEINLTANYDLQAFRYGAYAPDATKVAIVGTDGSYNSSQVLGLYVYDINTKKINQLFKSIDITLTDFGSGDFKQKTNSNPIIWKKDSLGVYAQVSHYGRVGLYEININDSYHVFSEADEQLFDFSLSANGKTMTIATTKPTSPNEIYLVDTKTKKRQQITNFNEAYLSDKVLVDYEEVKYTAEDGGIIHGFFVKPVNFDPNQSYPLIYNIHGGPHVMHAFSFFHEVQVMAAKGYAVLLINPRGSHGYGQKHANGVLGHYGEGDYRDLMTALDHIVAKYSWINQTRLHVTGGSYGGFMTNWIVTQTNRFRSAATQRSYCNVLSKGGCSDIGYYYTAWEMDTDIMDFEKFWKHSPLAYVKNVQTPLLFIHSENDYRCPISEAEQFFTYLKIMKQKTKFYRFPQSSHELSRNGIPSLRVERLEAIMQWFEEN